MNRLRFLLILALWCFSGFAKAGSPADKVEKQEYVLKPGHRKVWVYYPKGKIPEKLPCVLIGPGGTELYYGMDLSEGDSDEHYPYAAAGFVVVAFEISGPLDEDDLDKKPVVRKAVEAFTKSHGGIDDAKAALAFAASKHSFIDLKRVYIAGHSSAATVALTIAQDFPAIRGCVAYAPVTDLQKYFPKSLITSMSLADEGPKFSQYLSASSPEQNISKLQCPVFLFDARDDDIVPPAEVREYAAKLKAAGKTVDYKEVATGGHYESMINEGIPAGIAWLKKLDKSLPH